MLKEYDEWRSSDTFLQFEAFSFNNRYGIASKILMFTIKSVYTSTVRNVTWKCQESSHCCQANAREACLGALQIKLHKVQDSTFINKCNHSIIH